MTPHITRSYLKLLLDTAAAAHHKYEEALGKPDDDWSGWYAEHMRKAMEADQTTVAVAASKLSRAEIEESRKHSDMHQL